MIFGGYIDLNLECLEITEGQQCAIIHEAETTTLSLNITHQMPNTAPHSRRNELELVMEIVTSVRNVHCC